VVGQERDALHDPCLLGLRQTQDWSNAGFEQRLDQDPIRWPDPRVAAGRSGEQAEGRTSRRPVGPVQGLHSCLPAVLRKLREQLGARCCRMASGGVWATRPAAVVRLRNPVMAMAAMTPRAPARVIASRRLGSATYLPRNQVRRTQYGVRSCPQSAPTLAGAGSATTSNPPQPGWSLFRRLPCRSGLGCLANRVASSRDVVIANVPKVKQPGSFANVRGELTRLQLCLPSRPQASFPSRYSSVQ
jgi:hypothetical protein